MLRTLKDNGKTILLITHKLEEVMTVSDYVTVMRQGKVVAETATKDSNPRELARMMVGRDVILDIKRLDGSVGDVMLEAHGLYAMNDRGLLALNNLSLHVKAGEILGIAGVDGNGQSELAEVIAGIRLLTGGTIRVKGEDITKTSVADRKHRSRIGFVPEDRQRLGLVFDHTASQNLILRSYNKLPFARYGILQPQKIRIHNENLVNRYDVRLRSLDQPVRELSGGNQQKLILARELEEGLNVLVVSQPTKGLDVGAIEFVQKAILEQRMQGTAVLYISTELEHLMTVSDRIAVIFKGEISSEMPIKDVTMEKLGFLMAGGNS
jgi:simple sugar transport system ATP-binding protein